MKKLKIAVSGLGRIGWTYHLAQISSHEGFELAAVADPMQERLTEVKQKYGDGVKGYTSFGELLDNEKIDVAVVASPTLFHLEQVLAAFEHGVDVILEKPMAPSLEQADKIIESMRKHGRKLMVYQPERTRPEFQALKSILDRGVIGKVYMIKRGCNGFSRRNDWQSLKKYGGGMLNNYGAHYIDQMLNLAGTKVSRVSCSMAKVLSAGDADDVVKAIMETEKGIILDLDINMATAFPLPMWYVLGTNGTILTQEQIREKGTIKVRYVSDEELPPFELQTGLAASGRNYDDNMGNVAWHEETIDVSAFKSIDFYEKCYDYYALGKEPFVPAEETREVMRVISECRRSAGW